MENILIPRRLEGRAERYKIIIQRQIQEYIKNGSSGNLYLYKTPIEKLPDNLIKVSGSFWLGRSKIKTLNNVEIVKTHLDLQDATIESLGNLKEVGHHFSLTNTPIKSLGILEYIGGNFHLRDTKIESLDNLKYIGGDLMLQGTSIAKNCTKEEIREMIEVKGEIYMKYK